MKKALIFPLLLGVPGAPDFGPAARERLLNPAPLQISYTIWQEKAMTYDPAPESGRLARLHQLGILDTQDDRYFAAFTQRALQLFPGTSIAAVSLIDAERQWFKSVIGLDMKEMPRSLSLCSHTVQSSGVMIVEDATQDARFAGNPLVTSRPAIRFYAGVRLMEGIGTLCVIGLQPRRATEQEISKLTKLARFADIQLLAHGALYQLRGKPQDGQRERQEVLSRTDRLRAISRRHHLVRA